VDSKVTGFEGTQRIYNIGKSFLAVEKMIQRGIGI